MSRGVRTIVIIGGGFCGTVLAADLLRARSDVPTRIILVERRREVGRGVAYGRSEYPYVLNVPAIRMSVDPDDSLDFARFAARTHPELGGQAFLPREVYGEYLQDFLARAEANATSHIELRRIHAAAENILPLERSGQFAVGLSDREQLIADEVVLACGDPPPVGTEALRAIEHHIAYLRDPYGARLPFESMRNVLLVGTGLTMCDIAVAAASFNPEIRLHAVSRHGLLPATQSTAPAKVADVDICRTFEQKSSTAREMLRAFRHALRQSLSRGGDWRDAVGMARAVAPHLWAEMPTEEQSRFLRHVRTYWDVHRHRVPAATAHRLNLLRQAGRLEVHAGRIVDARTDTAQVAPHGGNMLRVELRTRRESERKVLSVDCVINCSGAYGRIGSTSDPLLQSLIRTGLAAPDKHGLGLQFSADGALVGAEGNVTRKLHYIGPMLRARHWEATAAGELRAYAAALAGKLVAADMSNCPGALSAAAYVLKSQNQDHSNR